MGERKIPEWARQESLSDLSWLSENLHVFWPAAQKQYQEQGRGAVVVDTTVQPVEGKGNPFAYFPQEMVAEETDADVQRMVKQYDPEREMVVVLLKSEEKVSSYRVRPTIPDSPRLSRG